MSFDLKQFFEQIKHDQSKNIPYSADATLCSCEVINAIRFNARKRRKRLSFWCLIKLWILGLKKRN